MKTINAISNETMGKAVVSNPTAKPVMMLVALPVSVALAIFLTGPGLVLCIVSDVVVLATLAANPASKQ
jgi:hypothetical protein